MPSLREAVDAHCRACVADSLDVGGWREQVAMCTSVSCHLFDVRPVPRACVHRGVIQRDAVAAVRAKLEARQAERRAA